MISLYAVIALVWMHFIADFVLQSDYVAKNKSKCNATLYHHCFIYSIMFLVFGIYFFIITLVTHFITDYISSRVTSKLWKQGRVHDFFVIIGLDQAIHMVTLFLTYFYLDNAGLLLLIL